MKKIFLYFIGTIATILLLTFLWLWTKSPGEPELFVDEKGDVVAHSISTIDKVVLGEIDQYLIIRGKDLSKPVLLFLHGGPGSPEYALVKEHCPQLEEEFVVVYWQQRGAGMSYSSEVSKESMNVAQFLADTEQLSKYLVERFDQDKIYLMGHSWGSFIGIQAAERYPELYRCYFGIGQVANQYRAEEISFNWIKEQAEENKDSKAIEQIAELSFPDSLAGASEWMDFLLKERQFVNKFGGGIFKNYSSDWQVVGPFVNAQEYTVLGKINIGRGALFSLESLWEEIMWTNLNETIDSVRIPVYIFQGIDDYQTSFTVANEFFEQLKAPKKKLIRFESSAHCPIFDEPEKFIAELNRLK